MNRPTLLRNFIILFLFSFLCLQSSFASEGVLKNYVEEENQLTPGADVPTSAFDLEYVELPLSEIVYYKGLKASSMIEDLLIDEAHGVFRWVLHPTDKKYKEKILNYLKINKIPHVVKSGITGHMMISRSLLIQYPGSEKFFSLKTSTDGAPGPWPDRPQQVRSASSSLLINDYLMSLENKSWKHTVFLPEPQLFVFPGVNLAQNSRLYSEAIGDNYEIFPSTALFSKESFEFLNEWLGNNANDEIMRVKIARLFGESYAEVFLNSGVIISSSHLQQFVLVKSKTDPTDVRIAWRDYADSHLHGPIVHKNGGKELLRHTKAISFDTRKIVTNPFIIFSPFHGFMENEKISVDHPFRAYFQSDQNKEKWMRPFYEGLQKRIQEISGKRFEVVNASRGPHIVFAFKEGPQSILCSPALTGGGVPTLPVHDIQFPPPD